MKTERYVFDREIPVYAEPDVLVVGGGPAGIAAAYCAARRGRKTLLAERGFCLGGTATASLVGPFMTCSNPDGTQMLVRGFFAELVQRLMKLGGADNPMKVVNGDAHSSWHPHGHQNVTPFNSEILKIVAEDMCREQGVQLLYGVQAIDVKRDSTGTRIESVIFAAKEGLIAVRPKMVIDCTGDGDIAWQAGCPMAKGDEVTGEMQACGFFFNLTGVDDAVLEERCATLGWQSMRFEKEIAEAVANGDYPIPRRRLGIYKSCDGTWRANITRIPDTDGTTSAGLTHVAVEGRKQMVAILNFLRKYVHGFERVELVESASAPGIRETRRIIGEFVLKSEDLQNGVIFDDAVLLCSNSIDVHTGMTGCYEAQKEIYSLPYRIFVPQKADNLLVAGRNVSCDRRTLAAIRVMPPCFGMGQAAGNAAVLALDGNCSVSAISVAELQKRLRAENVLLDFPSKPS